MDPLCAVNSHLYTKLYAYLSYGSTQKEAIKSIFALSENKKNWCFQEETVKYSMNIVPNLKLEGILHRWGEKCEHDHHIQNVFLFTFGASSAKKGRFFLRNKIALLIYKLNVQLSMLQSLNPVPFSFPSHFIESGGKLILWQSLGLPNFSFEIVTLFVFVNGSYFF